MTKKFSIFISPPDFITYDPINDYQDKLLGCWIKASEIFKRCEYYYENEKIIIETDWKKVKRQFSFSIENKVELFLSITGSKDQIELCDYFLTRFLEMMFITMNFSVPGALKLFNSELKDLNKNRNSLHKDWVVSLSSDAFETFWETSGELNHWPEVSFIPLESVVSWYDGLDIMFKHKASNNLERSIFSMINFCQIDSVSPANLIWLTHSLEALYDTPKEGIVSSLKKRLFIFLGEPKSHSNYFLKKIGLFYDLRSQFVHGNMEIAREPFFENLDDELQNYIHDMIKMCDFGVMLILSTVQKMIINNAKKLEFSEHFEIKN